MSTLAVEAERGPPTAEAVPPSLSLGPDDELVFPFAKCAFAQYWQEEGAPAALRIFYRDKELAFDDPAFFTFGETLIGQSRFRAGEAGRWGTLGWPRVREMLEQLVAAGILRRSDETDALPPPLRPDEREPPLSPAPCRQARTWDESDQIMRLYGADPIAAGHVELVVPIFRVAHMYLDADDRQIGEANVFPSRMRLDRPTSWRTCTYSGSRYQAEKPMNVTALRIMRQQWRQMMAIVRRVSEAYQARFPAVGERGWTVGHVERMTVCVLALPTYLLMRREGRIANGRLHPALSSAFRLADGLRILMHTMLFTPLGEAARPSDAPMTASEAHAYAERNYSFHTGRTVCAGPPGMIDDFLAVALAGENPQGGWPKILDAEVADALGVIEPAIDYGLMGLQAFASVFSLFPVSMAARGAVGRILWAWKGPNSAGLETLRAAFEPVVETVPAGGWLDEAEVRRRRLAAYYDMYGQCGYGLTGRCPEPSLQARYEQPPPPPAKTLAALETAFARRLGDVAGHDALSADLAACLGRFIAFVQAALRTSLEVQGRINALLGRSAAGESIAGRDLARYTIFRGGARPPGASEAAPFLVDEIADLLGVTVGIDAGAVTVAPAPLRSRAG
jgi:hypothetical protein